MARSVLARLDQSPNVIPEGALIDRRTNKPKRVPKRVQHALRLLLNGKHRYASDAAKTAGLTPEHLSRMMRKPHVEVFIAEERRRTISEGSLIAAGRMVELMHAESEHVSLDASKHVLAIEGITAKGQGISVDVNIRAGFVIDISESDAPGAGVIDGQAISVDTAALDNKGK